MVSYDWAANEFGGAAALDDVPLGPRSGLLYLPRKHFQGVAGL